VPSPVSQRKEGTRVPDATAYLQFNKTKMQIATVSREVGGFYLKRRVGSLLALAGSALGRCGERRLNLLFVACAQDVFALELHRQPRPKDLRSFSIGQSLLASIARTLNPPTYRCAQKRETATIALATSCFRWRLG
jgi:hypothetical protein